MDSVSETLFQPWTEKDFVSAEIDERHHKYLSPVAMWHLSQKTHTNSTIFHAERINFGEDAERAFVTELNDQDMGFGQEQLTDEDWNVD